MKKLTELIASDKSYERMIAVRKSKRELSEFFNDPSPEVRAELARQGKAIKFLMKDEDEYVRDVAIIAKAIREKKDPEELIKDNDDRWWIYKEYFYQLRELAKDKKIKIEVSFL